MISLPPLCASFYVLLQALDIAIATAVRESGCRKCGGPLHRSTYPRKPRGLPPGANAEIRRLSFCCAVDGCRTRHTPPSVQFYGRKVYVSAVLALCCMGRHSPTPNVLRRLRALFGVDPRTVHRWRAAWQLEVPRTVWWQQACGLMPAASDTTRLPGVLLQQFGRLADFRTWVAFLQWINPLTARSLMVL